MDAALLGRIIVIVLWVIVLVPAIFGLVRFVRTTRLSDLVPRIRRVRVIR